MKRDLQGSGLLTERIARTIESVGYSVRPGARVLDYGCGAGHFVQALRAAGYDAVGFDVVDYVSPDCSDVRSLIRHGEPSKLPFDGGEFDVIVSHQVFEHVMKYEVALRELARITRPNTGVGLHILPARASLLERHVYVPLASVFRPYWYLHLWATLGIRNEFQRGLSAREVAELNYWFLHEQTQYPPTKLITSLARQFFEDVRWVELEYLRARPSGLGWQRRLALETPYIGPLVGRTFSSLAARVLLVAKAPPDRACSARKMSAESEHAGYSENGSARGE
jgi:SAM-dependent methyltransferase